MRTDRIHPDGPPGENEAARTLREIADHLAAIRAAQSNGTREWLTVSDVANELQVSKDTVERLIAGGALKVAVLRTTKGRGRRRRCRIRREWVSDLLLKNVQSPHGVASARRRLKPDQVPDFIE